MEAVALADARLCFSSEEVKGKRHSHSLLTVSFFIICSSPLFLVLARTVPSVSLDVSL